jgi:hypothetical protein
MAKYNLITDAAELAKTGKELANDIRNTDERIAIYLLSEVAHIEQHRNPTRLNQFFSRVKGTGARINAMHNFIQVFANVTFNKEANSAIKADGSLNDNNKFGRRDESGEVFAWYYTVNKKERFQKKPEELQTKIIAKAEEQPWFKFQPERAPVQFDADQKLLGVVKSFWSTALKGDVKISRELLNDLTELVFKHGVMVDGKPVTAVQIIPASVKVTDVPKEYRPMLHLVADNTNEEPKKAETPTARKSVAKSA